MKPISVDALIIYPPDHLDVLHFQRGPMDPARRLPEPLSVPLCLALKQDHLPRRRVWLWSSRRKAATRLGRITYAPFLFPFREVQRRAHPFMNKKLAHIKANSPCTNNRNTLTNLRLASENIYITQDMGHILPLNLWITRQDTRRHNDLIKAVKIVRSNFASKFKPDTMLRCHCAKPVDKAPELFLARDLLRHIQLPADFISAVKDCHFVSPLRSRNSRAHSGRSGADNSNSLGGIRAFKRQLGLKTRARIDKTA